MKAYTGPEAAVRNGFQAFQEETAGEQETARDQDNESRWLRAVRGGGKMFG
jgi:hypothetical protein